ncbi:MAG: cobalamin biosynthesis protein, partial [Nitrospira sp.]
MTGGELVLAAVLDVVAGDPRWMPHPVRGMGVVISWFDNQVRTVCRSDQSLQIAGACLALGLPVAIYAAATWLIAQAAMVSPLLGQLVSIG